MFRKILVALDGSTFSEHALPYAVQAARSTGAELILSLVHVRQSPVTTDLALRQAIDAWEQAHAQREEDYLDAVAARLRTEHGLKARGQLLRGEVVPALERAIDEDQVDLVVITTHGRAGLERAWLGSVTDALVRAVDAPVLVVRPAEGAPPRVNGAGRFHHALIALDGSERAERTVAPVRALLEPDARVSLLRVVAPPSAVTSPFLPHAVRISHEELQHRTDEANRYIDDMRERLRADAPGVEASVVTDYHPAHAILSFAEDTGADIIAVGTHGRGPIRRLVMGSVSDKVVRAANIPVLVC